MNRIYTLLLLPAVLSFSSCNAKQKNQSPVEVGSVKWLRNLDTAQAQAVKKQKPIFLLFQEVPG